MKIQVKSTIEPLYGKIPRRFRQWIPVIDGYATRVTARYEVLEPKDGEPALSMKLYVAHAYGTEFEGARYTTHRWEEDDTVSLLVNPIGSGYSEVRVYLKGLDESDELLTDQGTTQEFMGRDDSERKYRYYCRPFRAYSLLELVTVFLAGSVLIFTVLLCILTFVLAVLTYSLSILQAG